MKKSEKITLRKLNLKKDISKKYQNWMNDIEVHKYTEQKSTLVVWLNVLNLIKKQ